MSLKSYVFIEAKTHSGISAKNNQPYTLRKIRFADPLTFENHQLSFSEHADFNNFKKGDLVHLQTELETYFNRDSNTVVTGLTLASK